MLQELSDPFASDATIPDMKTTEDFAPFEVPGFETAVTPPHRSQWPILLVIAGAVLLVAALAIGAWLLLSRSAVASPEPTMRAYYDALEAKDFARVTSLMDPDVVLLTENILPTVAQIQSWIQAETGLNVELDWDFQDLVFDVQNLTTDSATVQVTGRVRVYEKLTNLGAALPYTWSHALVNKNGRWYVEP